MITSTFSNDISQGSRYNVCAKALMELQAKSCEQDQIPTKIVKSRTDTFIKPYTKLVNLSIIYSQFDDSWKSAIL